MNKFEYSAALHIAQSKDDLSIEDTDVFFGLGLGGFVPVHVTLRQVARLMRWQALQLNGQWDGEALNEIAIHGRRNFIIVGHAPAAIGEPCPVCGKVFNCEKDVRVANHRDNTRHDYCANCLQIAA